MVICERTCACVCKRFYQNWFWNFEYVQYWIHNTHMDKSSVPNVIKFFRCLVLWFMSAYVLHFSIVSCQNAICYHSIQMCAGGTIIKDQGCCILRARNHFKAYRFQIWNFRWWLASFEIPYLRFGLNAMEAPFSKYSTEKNQRFH